MASKARQSLALMRAVALSGVFVAAATCADQGPAAPRDIAPGHAALSVKPNFEAMPAGGPSIPLSRIHAVLTGPSGDTFTADAKFSNGQAVLEFNIPIMGPAEFVLTATAFDASGAVAYTFTQRYILHPGTNASLPTPTFKYAGIDAGLTAFKVVPSSLTLAAGASASLAASGTLANGQTISPNVGWTSSDPTVATVDASGGVTAGQSQGTATITATSATGLTATALVKVTAPVAKVTATPATLLMIRGNSANVSAELRDAGNHLIDDRTATWTSSDASIATVSATGGVTAVKIGQATLTATAEGKTATVAVTVISPVASIDLSPAQVLFVSLQDGATLSAKLIPVTGASVTGLTLNFTSNNTNVVKVDSKGVLTSVANGVARVTAEIDGITAFTDVTVQQTTNAIALSPRAVGVSAIGDSRTFSVTLTDAKGNVMVNPTVSWSASDPSVASVVGSGTSATVTAKKAGSTSIIATSDTKVDAGTFIVAPTAKLLIVQSDKAQILTGQTATMSAYLGDANGFPVSATTATYSTTTPNVASVSGNIVTGLSPGIARIVGTSGALTASIDITVNAPVVPGGGLTISPASVQKLPRGTQQFSVQAGGNGPFTWQVNGVQGGSATFGTITAAGFYTAPASVPTPATFNVCAVQASPAAQGCAQVTIAAIPTAGADVIVFNDVNVFDSPGSGDLNNQTMFRNLVTFATSGPRANQTGVMYYNGHNSGYFSGFPTMTNVITQAGYTVTTFSAALTSPIAPNIKVIFLWLPTVQFNLAEINNLKSFSSEGGRIVFIGEHAQFYGAGIPIENNFFLNMGAQMTNAGGLFDCGFAIEPASSLRPHQVTTGVTQITVACASEVIPGPNDYPFMYDLTNTHVLAAAAKVDVTPSVVLLSKPSPKSRTAPMVTSDGIRRDPKDPAGRPLTPP